MLVEKHISTNPDAKVLVLFGGNPARRDEVIRQLKNIPDLSIIGTLSEEEGIDTVKKLKKVDLVLIGGRYNPEQRIRIRSFMAANYPHIKITEPGVDYPYNEVLIMQHVQQLMQ